MKKKADKPNVTINVNILSNIKLDGKSLICIIIAIIYLTLVMSICDPTIYSFIYQHSTRLLNTSI